MIGPNSRPQHQGDLRQLRPDLHPPSRGNHRQMVSDPSLQHHRVVLGNLNKVPPDPQPPRISTRTVRCLKHLLQDRHRPLEDPLLRHPIPTHKQRGQAQLLLRQYLSTSTRAPHRRNPSRSRNLTRGGSWLLIVPYTLCSMRNSGSNFEILNMSFEVDRGHVKCNNRETANKV